MSDKKEIKLRNFEIDDLEIVLEIIDAIGIEEFTECFKNVNIDKNEKNININSIGVDVGVKIISKVIKNAKKCLNPLYELIARLSGTEVEEARHFNLLEVSKALIKLVKSEECRDFLELVSSLKN